MTGLKPTPTSSRFQDLTGCRFGRQTVVGYAGTDRRQQRLWLVRCSCDGNERAVHAYKLLAETTRSCGCLKLELFASRFITHGASRGRRRRPEYQTWIKMRERCNSVSCRDYPAYGGRGIRVCARWLDSFAAFLEDVGQKPTPQHSIDRIDNGRGYDCGKCGDCQARGAGPNCRWATPREQSNNHRRNRTMTCGGRVQTCSEWAREKGMSVTVLLARLNQGWRDEDAVSVPVREMRLSPAAKLERVVARRCVRSAVAAGLLPPVASQKCVRCGRAAQEYHHHQGYAEDRRLDVVPACRRCHHKVR